jgi:hypothetical protein
MRVSDCVQCETFPCEDVNHGGYRVPVVKVDPSSISLVLISEAAAPDPADNYYAPGEPLFEQTTLLAFQEATALNPAGAGISSFADLLGLGVYLTTAVKCSKTGYGIKAATIKECSTLLERELSLFPNLQAYLLMGDVAIKALNYIARRAGEGRVTPAGSTYKIRGQPYHFQGRRVFPSYLQAGPSFFIEKSKRTMIAEDLAEALRLIQASEF